MKVQFVIGILCTLILWRLPLYAQPETDSLTANDLIQMPLEEILNIPVLSASKKQESLANAPSSISVIRQSEIAAYQANSLYELIDRIASVYVLSTSYFLRNNVIGVRGEATQYYSQHVLLLMNGRPMREHQFNGWHTPVLYGFPINRIARIEVIRGPGSVLYGSNAYSAVVNIITRAAENQPTSAQFTAGSFETIKSAMSTSVSAGDWQVALGFNHFRNRGWPFTSWGYGTQPDGSTGRLPARTIPAKDEYAGAQVSLQYNNWHLHHFSGVHEQQLMGNIAWAFQEIHYQTLRSHTELGYTWQHQSKAQTKLHAGYGYYRMRQKLDQQARDYREYGVANEYTMEATHFRELGDAWDVTAGMMSQRKLGASYNPRRTRSGDAFDIYSGKNPDPYAIIPPYGETDWQFYLQLGLDWKKTRVIAGGQLLKTQDLAWAAVPRLGVLYHVTPRLTAKLLYGQAYRAPGLAEKYIDVPDAIIGNHKLRPEQVTSVDALLLYAKKDLWLSLGYFYIQQKHLISRTTALSGGPPTYINDGRLELQGLEGEMKLKRSPRWQAQASFTYSQSSDKQNINSYAFPDILLKAGASTRLWNFAQLALFHSYAGPIIEVNYALPEANPAPKPFHFTTLSVQVDIHQLLAAQLSNQLTAKLYVRNVFNQSVYYPDYGTRSIISVPGRPKRNFYLSLKWGI